MRLLLGIALLILSLQNVSGQQNYLPLHSYYRDQVLVTNRAETYAGDCMFPITEEECNIYKYFKDSTVYYYNLPEVLFKKHIIEVKDTDTYIKISPVFNFSYGKDLINQFNRNLFDNTRGFLAEVNLGKNIALFTTFYENQSRFSTYETYFIRLRGEAYNNGTGYHKYNAVIPGGGRTKPFKLDGFDYAYAIGQVNWKISKKTSLTVGNNQQFIGAGYRSLLLSDNSYSSPHIRFNWSILNKFRIHIIKARDLNLIRKKKATTVESYYEPKGFSAFYFSYQPTSKVNISFFEGSIWSDGDSLNTTHLPFLYYSPLPFTALLEKNSKRSSLYGINFDLVINSNARVYSQIVCNNPSKKQIGLQIGFRGIKSIIKRNLLYQFEINYASDNLYENNNHFIDYSHYNLPIAHPAGNSFIEFVHRSSYEYKRFYGDIRLIGYKFFNRQSDFLMPVRMYTVIQNNFELYSNLELGYRMNKKINWSFFAKVLYRTQFLTSDTNNFVLTIGMKTDLINHYNDY